MSAVLSAAARLAHLRHAQSRAGVNQLAIDQNSISIQSVVANKASWNTNPENFGMHGCHQCQAVRSMSQNKLKKDSNYCCAWRLRRPLPSRQAFTSPPPNSPRPAQAANLLPISSRCMPPIIRSTLSTACTQVTAFHHADLDRPLIDHSSVVVSRTVRFVQGRSPGTVNLEFG